jgi:DNA mismatch repair protein MutS2
MRANEHSLELLEFDRIKDTVAGYCHSPEGRQCILKSEPSSDKNEVAKIKNKVSAIITVLQDGEEGPKQSFAEIHEAIRKLSKSGSTLEDEELFALGMWADAYYDFIAFAKRVEKHSIDLGTREAPDLGPAAKIVFRVFNKDGSLRDIPELKEARSRIARVNREIASISDSYYRDPDIRAILQSDEPTIRDGRTVLPVKANFKGRIRGIVHEISSTGQTVFIEPEELVQKNNEIVQEEARLRQEMARVFRETTERLRVYNEDYSRARSIIAELDGLYARARHARNGGLCMARDLDSGFVIRKARHPLLGQRAVPIDVDLPEGTQTLVITGPNTGGKTVTLKTIGLLALMNQFGLALPAAPETGFAVFDAVYADIGDEQSIDQSLSTFSGHMRVIGGIVEAATGKSLVLLDELGSGTDPEEGCAVAMSLLDWFIERGCLTVVTTHHGILKNYGYSKPACLNASMDFDASSLSPTYRILMGVPGESRALEVAVKNGLPEIIVTGARKYLAEERADVSELIRGLTEKHRKLEDMESDRLRRLREAKEEQRKADLGKLRVRRMEIELREKGVADLRRLLSEGRKTLENLVKELREGELTSEKTKAVKKFLAELSEQVEGEAARLENLKREELEESARIEEQARDNKAAGISNARDSVINQGVEVLAGPARKRGIVVRPAKKGSWVVEIESIRMTFPESELIPLHNAPATNQKPQIQVELAPRGESGRALASFELDLRGYRLAEAIDAVERQIDAASLQGLTLFSIVHGMGEGVLGKGIHEYLRSHPAVADFHFARPEEGGYGKTIVRLK